jgi:hypothetical protein
MPKSNSHLKIKRFGSSCDGVELFGDIKNPEKATFAVYFPGGHIEITRTSSGSYWIHTGLLRSDNSSGERNDGRAIGTVVDSIVDNRHRDNRYSEIDVDAIKATGDWHFAVEIKTV